jgi:YtkA-like
MSHSRLHVCGLSVALLLVSACGDDAAKEPPESESASAGEHAHDDEEEDTAFEGCPDATPEFAIGMQAEGMLGHITGTLLGASNVPPLRYLNDWRVEFVDAAGEPVEDVEVRSARPFMPVHGHDGNVKPVVHTEEPGRFSITGLNLNMRGPWEIQFQLRSARAGDDYVVFHICVQE